MASMYKRIEKKGLCPRDLNKRIEVYERNLSALAPGDVDARSKFTLKFALWAAIETISMTRQALVIGRSDGVQQGTSDATHFFYLHYTPRLYKMEPQKTFIKYSGDYYRVIGFENMNELNRVIVINAALRGDTGKEAAQS